MTKIIKQGFQEFQTICPYCGCLFEYVRKDIRAKYVRCPDCQTSFPHQDMKEWAKEHPNYYL